MAIAEVREVWASLSGPEVPSAGCCTCLLYGRGTWPLMLKCQPCLCAIMLGMEEMIRQIRAASAVADLYFLALFGALALPDICGALVSSDGRASKSKYTAWLRDNVPEHAAQADMIYGLRCSLLHQGRSLPHGGNFPIACTYPSPETPQLHNLSTASNGSTVGWLSIPIFVDEMTRGAESWFQKFGTTETVIRNMEKFARIRPEGLPPHASGIPIIA